MISLLVAYLALFNRWLDDGGTVANFYDKPGLIQIARECGIYAWIWPWWLWWKKNNLFRGVSTLLRRTYVRFDKESHGSSIHPDLNMSEFSKLAIGKSFLGKVVRFFYSFTLRRMGRPAPFYEGYLFCFFWGGEIKKKQLPSSLHYRSCQAFVEKMFVFLWKVKALTPVAQILVPRQSSIFWKKEKTLSNLQPSVTSWLSNSYITWEEGKVGPSGNC